MEKYFITLTLLIVNENFKFFVLMKTIVWFTEFSDFASFNNLPFFYDLFLLSSILLLENLQNV